MKKIISLILCMVMVLGLAVTGVGAAHDHVITINSQAGYEYVAFQIFKGDLDKTGTLSNITWGSAVEAKSAELLLALKDMSSEFAGCNTADEVAGILANHKGHDNEMAKKFADLVGAKDGSGNYLYINESMAYTEAPVHSITVDSDGYYLIVNTKIPAGAENATVSRYMLEVVRDVNVAHKGTFPTVDKKIVEGTDKVTVNEASIGDVVNYEIVGTLPGNLADYDTYYYMFHDTLSKGLTYNGDAKVTVNGKDVTEYFYVGSEVIYDSSTPPEIVETKIDIGIPDILPLQYVDGVGAIVGGIETGTKIVVTYSATLNEHAVIAIEGNPNIVDLEYSNDPNVDGDGSTTPPPPPPEYPEPDVPTGITPEKIVETFTTQLKIQKTDGSGAALQGAQFHLTGEGVNMVLTTGWHYTKTPADSVATPIEWYKLTNGSYTKQAPTPDDPATPEDEGNADLYESATPEYAAEEFAILEGKGSSPVDVKAFVNAAGQLTFTGLGVGKYTLTETITPAGFNTIAPIEFTVAFNPETKEFRVTDNTLINVGKDKADLNTYNSLYTTVVNEAGSKLPSTGGIGTTLFYVFGSLMALGAVVLLVTKKRMGNVQ